MNPRYQILKGFFIYLTLCWRPRLLPPACMEDNIWRMETCKKPSNKVLLASLVKFDFSYCCQTPWPSLFGS